MLKYIAASLSLALACQAHAADTAPRKTLTAFASEAQLQSFFKRYADEQRTMQKRRLADSASLSGFGAVQPPPPPVAPAPDEAVSFKTAGSTAESVTNTQVAGVDEGGIVKVHGKHLVMLRRGRLFTVNIERGQLAPVSTVDAYAPDADPAGSWYDELLISGDTVVVIGYSYQRGGTEIGLFDIDHAGRLSYRATYHMRSNDYYSSRNYASRQIGSKLIFYAPLYLNPWQPDPLSLFPAMRRWHPNATPGDFKRIAPATRIYRTDDPLEPGAGMALHTVTVCDLGRREMTCEASAVLGPRGREFYVSGESVYVWTTPTGRYGRHMHSQSGLFRLPLDGGAPSALKVGGAPVDQFSFLESGDGHLNVLLRGDGPGTMALMRVPLHLFSDGRDSAPPHSYKALPGIDGNSWQNRYVGPYLLYGSSSRGGWDRETPHQALYALRWDGRGETQTLGLRHGVERIEAMGEDAVVVGSSGKDLHFTSVSLGREASLSHRYIRENAAQGETRSHGFFYKPGRADEGIVGLPIMHGQRGGPGASVLYLRNSALKLDELGSLQARRGRQGNDVCRASCVDWYGNARPLFLKGRVFALMGYELVEGKVDGERLTETRRISYAP